VGNLNLILVIALSQAWLHEEVALFQHFGTLAGKSLQDMEALKGFCFRKDMAGWWFGTVFIFHNIWDNPSH